jgi:hypothetical protein
MQESPKGLSGHRHEGAALGEQLAQSDGPALRGVSSARCRESRSQAVSPKSLTNAVTDDNPCRPQTGEVL